MEDFKRPEWQKKRLEILERDNFKCNNCRDSGITLHIHHYYYEKGNKPWEYPNKALVTLCSECHGFEHDFSDHFTAIFKKVSLGAANMNLIIQAIERDFDSITSVNKRDIKPISPNFSL